MRKLPLVKTSSRRDAVGAVRLARERRSLDCVGESAGGGAVLRRDDAVGDERAVEGDDRVAAARERAVVEADAVVDRPGREREQRAAARNAAAHASLLAPRRRAATSGKSDEREEHGVSRPREGERARRRARRARSVRRRAGLPPAREKGPERERGREHRLARDLVEHQAVRRVHEQRDRRRDGGPGPERPRGGGPGDDRAGEEHRQ